jgi:hypothetical protein
MRQSPLSENRVASMLDAVWRAHSGVLDCFSQKPGIQVTPRMIAVFVADFVIRAEFSTLSPGFAETGAENGPKTEKNMPIAVNNAYSLPDLNIAIP